MNDNSDKNPQQQADELGEARGEWGQVKADHFGYKSEEERLAKRGLEDWELVDKIPESQRGIPKWFIAVILVVLLVAIGLSFPFWGDRPGYERSWVDWGFGAALLYIAIMSVFVYLMVNLYGSNIGGKLDSDKQNQPASKPRQDATVPKQDSDESSQR
jgi:hypothetical protein